MDAFFASVEQRDNPELRGKPIAVGFDGPRGVVSTASYEARPYGVHSAMSMAQAKRRCPQLIVVPTHFEKYKEVSQQIHAVFHEYTDLVEPISLDEAFLDVTDNKKGIELAVDIAKEIKQKIHERTSLTASAGISFNKLLAKIASDMPSRTVSLRCIPTVRSISLGAYLWRSYGVSDRRLLIGCMRWGCSRVHSCGASRANISYRCLVRWGVFITTSHGVLTIDQSLLPTNVSR